MMRWPPLSFVPRSDILKEWVQTPDELNARVLSDTSS
jgi:hypothetical protein